MEKEKQEKGEIRGCRRGERRGREKKMGWGKRKREREKLLPYEA